MTPKPEPLTLRTDEQVEQVYPYPPSKGAMVPADFARTLERELAERDAELARVKLALEAEGMLLGAELSITAQLTEQLKQAESAMLLARREMKERCASVCKGMRTHHPHRDNRIQDATLTVAAERILTLPEAERVRISLPHSERAEKAVPQNSERDAELAASEKRVQLLNGLMEAAGQAATYEDGLRDGQQQAESENARLIRANEINAMKWCADKDRANAAESALQRAREVVVPLWVELSEARHTRRLTDAEIALCDFASALPAEPTGEKTKRA